MKIGDSRFEKTGSVVGAEDATARAVKQFDAAVTNAEQPSNDAWGRSVSPKEAAGLLTRARKAILEIDAAAKASGTLPALARDAINAIFTKLTTVIPQGSRNDEGTWVVLPPSKREGLTDMVMPDRPIEEPALEKAFSLESGASAQNRKNHTAYKSLKTLVTRLTSGRPVQ